MLYSVVVDHEGAEVQLELDASVEGGRPAKLNPPGQAHPGEPPHVSDVWDLSIVWDEENRDLDPDIVFESHQEEIEQNILKQASRRYE